MNGPEFWLFSKRNCIVNDFCQVILEHSFSFAPVGNLSAHHLWNPIRWNHISSICSCLVVIDIVFSMLYHKGQLLILLVDPDRTVILQYIPIVISFYMSITLHVPSPFLISCMVAFRMILMLAQKNCTVFSNQLL